MEQHATLKVTWIDNGREPKCKPNPAYPTGIDIDISEGILGVNFRMNLAPNGEVERVHLSKNGITISLTAEQAKTLAKELEKRF